MKTGVGILGLTNGSEFPQFLLFCLLHVICSLSSLSGENQVAATTRSRSRERRGRTCELSPLLLSHLL